MTVRELITNLGFTMDEAKLRTYEQKGKALAGEFAGLGNMFGAAMGIITAAAAYGVTRIADEWANVDARIGLVTSSQEEQYATQKKLYDMALATRQEYGSTADLFTKVQRNAKQLGTTLDENLRVTELVSKGMIVSGAGTQEANSAILQLGQALASGVLRGEELNSVMENAPRLAQSIADGMGVTIGQLRAMGAQGTLTAQAVVKAILKSGGALDKEFRKMPVTVGQALTVVQTRFGNMINNISRETGIFREISWGIMDLAAFAERGINKIVALMGGWKNVMQGVKVVMMAVGSFALAVLIPRLIIGIKQIGNALTMLIAKNPMILALSVAIMAVLLAIEDIYGWTQGKDSIMGLMFGDYETYAPKIQAFLDLIWNDISYIFNGVKPYIDEMKASFNTAGEAILNLIRRIVGANVNWGTVLRYLISSLVIIVSIIVIMAIKVVDFVVQAIGLIANIIAAIINIWTIIAKIIADARKGVGGFINSCMELLTMFCSWISGLFLGAIKGIGTAISDYILSPFEKAFNFIKNLPGATLVGNLTAQQYGAGGGSTSTSSTVSNSNNGGNTFNIYGGNSNIPARYGGGGFHI